MSSGRRELCHQAATIWGDIHDAHAIARFLLVCELPLTFLRKATIPVPCEEYYCRAVVALSVLCSPLWFLYYLWNVHHWNVLATEVWPVAACFEIIACALALCILRFAPSGEGQEPNREMPLVFSTPIALYGFVMAATWIDTISNALVSLLNFVGIIFRIPGPVIGLTVLAW